MKSVFLSSTPIWTQVSGAASSQEPAAAGTPMAESTGQSGEEQGAPAGPCGAMGSQSSIIMMVLMFVVFYFLLIRPQQKKAKEHQKMLTSIGKGDEIVTTGGLVGRVTGVSDKLFTVEISEKVRVRIVRSQVSGTFSGNNAEKK